MEVTGIIIELMKSVNDYVIRYECCLCLNSIIKIDTELKINYGILIETVIPIILELFEKFFNANIVWRLIHLLNLILEKSQWIAGNDLLLKSFQTTGLKSLLKAESELLNFALIDMFTNLIVSLQQNKVITPIFTACIEFINNGLVVNFYLCLWIFNIFRMEDTLNS